MPEATIASFILRFTKEHAMQGDRVAFPWRGVIRHVQTSEEIRFTRIDDALDFVSHFVDITQSDECFETILFPEKGEL
jgi:hypothetical protein